MNMAIEVPPQPPFCDHRSAVDVRCPQPLARASPVALACWPLAESWPAPQLRQIHHSKDEG